MDKRLNESENQAESLLFNNKFRWGIVGIALLIGLFFILASRNPSTARLLKPFVATSTPNTLRIDSEPIPVEFAELEDNPLQFRNQRIEVSGAFSHITLPNCRVYSGPRTEWGLINDTLQMNAVGFEKVVRPLPNQLEMRVQGVWRFYAGPVGCGKESQIGRGLWYLDVEQILQPNPLPIAANNGVIVVDSSSGETIELIPEAGASEEGESEGTTTLPTPTLPSVGGNPTGTPAITISTLTPTSSSVGATSTVPPIAATATDDAVTTAVPGSTSTPTATRTPTATATPSDSDATPTRPLGPPPAPTATPGSGGGGGYNPAPPPAPTSTPDDGGGGGGGYP